ncbi:MAG: helicase-associated domain-containing protein, partial [Gemmatimonadetes bacterium]|nr:helicase-associated domain-containing protein [Gemmatimonadota bacterium]
GAIDRGIVPVPADLVTGTPPELNDLLAAGALDVSVVSAVEYARNAATYHLLPDLAVSCDGPVRSVLLFSRRPVEELDQGTILLSASSRTSVYLLRLLCQDVWHVRPRFAEARNHLCAFAELERSPEHIHTYRISPLSLWNSAATSPCWRHGPGDSTTSMTWPRRRPRSREPRWPRVVST